MKDGGGPRERGERKRCSEMESDIKRGKRREKIRAGERKLVRGLSKQGPLSEIEDDSDIQ